MSIAIIIPAKNEEATLPGLLESLAMQTEQPDEVIVMNSHSTDRTVELARSFKTKLPIAIYNAATKGATAARNEGAAKATADYLVFIDADVTLPKSFVAVTKRAIRQRHLNLGAYRQVMPSKNLGIRVGSKLMNGYVKLMSHTPWPICFSCFFIQRELFERIGGFDPEIFIMEDYDLSWRGRKHGGRFGVVKGTHFQASPRRYETEQGGQSILNGFYAEFYRYTHGMRVTKPLFEYKMGGQDTPKDKK